MKTVYPNHIVLSMFNVIVHMLGGIMLAIFGAFFVATWLGFPCSDGERFEFAGKPTLSVVTGILMFAVGAALLSHFFIMLNREEQEEYVRDHGIIVRLLSGEHVPFEQIPDRINPNRSRSDNLQKHARELGMNLGDLANEIRRSLVYSPAAQTALAG